MTSIDATGNGSDTADGQPPSAPSVCTRCQAEVPPGTGTHSDLGVVCDHCVERDALERRRRQKKERVWMVSLIVAGLALLTPLLFIFLVSFPPSEEEWQEGLPTTLDNLCAVANAAQQVASKSSNGWGNEGLAKVSNFTKSLGVERRKDGVGQELFIKHYERRHGGVEILLHFSRDSGWEVCSPGQDGNEYTVDDLCIGTGGGHGEQELGWRVALMRGPRTELPPCISEPATIPSSDHLGFP